MADPAWFWTLPPTGDGRDGVSNRRNFHGGGDGTDFGYYDYLLQVARAAKAGGFVGAFIPWDAHGEDPWIVAAGLVRQVRGFGFVPALQPGFATPVYVAKMSASFQRLSGQRLAWAINLDGSHEVRRAHGDVLAGADWFERAEEFITAARGVFQQTSYAFRGHHYEVEAGGLEAPLSGQTVPSLTTVGGSPEALEFAARHADVHLLTSPAVAALEQERDRLAEAAAKVRTKGKRQVTLGVQLTIVARATQEEAKRDFDRALAAAPSHAGRGEVRAIEPHLWSGFDRLPATSPYGLVGSYEAVAARLDDLSERGVRHFVLGGRPSLEEALRFAEHVAPRLRGWRRIADTAVRARGNASAAVQAGVVP